MSFDLVLGASLVRDSVLFLGVPALVYGALLSLGSWAVGRRFGTGRGLAVGIPLVSGVLFIAIFLGLFAGVGAIIVGPRDDPTSDSFVGWGRFVLVALYALALVGSAVIGRATARWAGLAQSKLATVAVVATFVFVIVSAPFSSYLNACHVGNAILVNTKVSCR